MGPVVMFNVYASPSEGPHGAEIWVFVGLVKHGLGVLNSPDFSMEIEVRECPNIVTKRPQDYSTRSPSYCPKII